MEDKYIIGRIEKSISPLGLIRFSYFSRRGDFLYSFNFSLVSA